MDVTKGNTPEFWDSIAKPCGEYERRSSYAEEFMQKSGILPGESVLDMGCGSGTLCLPLSDDGHPVFCGDFSEKMLQYVREVIDAEGITNIETMRLTWEEDWDARGVPMCDLAYASRCLFDADPADAVDKLSRHAKRRVCLTMPVSGDMFKNPAVRYTIGSDGSRTEYMLKVVKAAYDKGYMPELSYMSGKPGKKNWAFIFWDV